MQAQSVWGFFGVFFLPVRDDGRFHPQNISGATGFISDLSSPGFLHSSSAPGISLLSSPSSRLKCSLSVLQASFCSTVLRPLCSRPSPWPSLPCRLSLSSSPLLCLVSSLLSLASFSLPLLYHFILSLFSSSKVGSGLLHCIIMLFLSSILFPLWTPPPPSSF